MEWTLDKSKDAPALSSSNLNSQQRPILPQSMLSYSISQAQFGSSMLNPAPASSFAHSKEEWEALRPVIRELYIQKHTKQKDLIKILREEHGFKITPKQLTNRLRLWNFWKNTPQSQRNAILYHPDDALQKSGSILPTSKISQAKLIRWKQEEIRRNDHRDPRASVTASGVDTLEIAVEPKAPELHTTTGYTRTSDKSVVQMETSALGTHECSQSHSPWNSLDLHSSPGLTRLFSQLKLEIEEKRPHLELPVPIARGFPKYVSGRQLNEKFPNEQSPDDFDAPITHPSLSFVPHTAYELFSRNRKHYLDADFTFPYLAACKAPTPYSEVYVFPSIAIPEAQRPSYNATLPEIEENDSKLRHIQRTRLFSPSDIRIVKMIRILVASCFSVGSLKYWEIAEYWCEQLLDNEDFEKYRTAITILTDRLNLVEAIYNRAQYRKALAMIDRIEGDLAQLVTPSDEILVRVLHWKSRALRKIGDSSNEEETCRNYLQKCLGTFGPNHGETLEAMFRLSLPLRKKGNLLQSEELLKIAIQLAEKISVTICCLIPTLADLKYDQGEYGEAVALGRSALEKARNNASEETSILRTEIRRGIVCIVNGLLKQGKLQETIEVIRECMERHNSRAKSGLRLVYITCFLGKLGRACKEKPEVKMAECLVKSFEKKQRRENMFDTCRESILQLREKTGIESQYAHELWYIEYAERWRQKQKKAEEDQAAGYLREFVTVEE